MNDYDIAQTIAKLDGCKEYHNKGGNPSGQWEGYSATGKFILFEDLPPYLTSRDAILSVILKTITDWKEFAYILADVMKLKCRPLDMTIAQIVEYVIKATPAQLCEALLRARAKMD